MLKHEGDHLPHGRSCCADDAVRVAHGAKQAEANSENPTHGCLHQVRPQISFPNMHSECLETSPVRVVRVYLELRHLARLHQSQSCLQNFELHSVIVQLFHLHEQLHSTALRIGRQDSSSR